MDVLTLIEPPAPLVEVTEIRTFLRVDDHVEDVLLASLAETATAFLDGEAGMLGRALGRQRWRLTLDGFARDGVHLPLPPLVSVDLIEYRAPDGTTAILSPVEYRTAILGAAPGLVRAVDRWPDTARGDDVVTIKFTAGYATVPAPIRTAILQHIATLYENRESAAYGTGSFQSVPFGGWDLVAAYARPCVG